MRKKRDDETREETTRSLSGADDFLRFFFSLCGAEEIATNGSPRDFVVVVVDIVIK